MKKESNYTIKQISSVETYIVRHPVLREGRPIEDCTFDNDDLETTLHFGLYTNNDLVGVATFLLNNNQLFSETIQYQLRGMGVLKSHQGFGFGDSLLQYGEQQIKLKKGTLIWFNARKIALGFYKKNNYQVIGDPFEITGYGTHYVMYKKL